MNFETYIPTTAENALTHIIKLRDDVRALQHLLRLGSIVRGRLVRGEDRQPVKLKAGPNPIAHGLGRAPNGWFLVNPRGPGRVYEPEPENLKLRPRDKFIELYATEALTTDIWVF